MNLKTNSWYVKLWDYMYAEDLPNNLCPFFWKLISAILLFIPTVILRIPVTIFNIFSINKIKKGDGRTGIGIIMYIIIVLLIFAILSIYHWILYLFNAYSYDNELATCGGFFLSVILLFIIRELWVKNDLNTISKEKISNNIIVNYTKSWYNNYCPKINWEENGK